MRYSPLVAITLIVVRASTTWAGNGIVLESYTGAKPDEANRLLSPVLDELANRGFVVGFDGVGRKFEVRISRASASLEGLPTDFGDQAERGHRAWIAGRFEDAVRLLSPLVDAARANAGAFTQNQALRDKLLIALIALALSQHRMGDPTVARETFGEILRTFPGAALSRGSYGPDAHALFEQVRKDASAQGRGRIVVKTPNESSVVFLNEVFLNVGSSTKGDLIPGEYRVFAQVGKQMSRTHVVVVRPNEESRVTIDAAFDAVVHTSPSWTGLGFNTAGDREKLEPGYAATFASAIGARAVAVVGIDRVNGRPVLVGALVNPSDGREIRRATLALDPDPPVDRLRSMARFLAGDPAAVGLDVELAGPITRLGGAALPRSAGDGGDAETSGGWSGWKWLTAGAALLALGTGSALLVLDGNCSEEVISGLGCEKRFETAMPGWIMTGSGAVLAAATVYLVVRGRASPTRTAYVVPVPGGAFAGFATSF